MLHEVEYFNYRPKPSVNVSFVTVFPALLSLQYLSTVVCQESRFLRNPNYYNSKQQLVKLHCRVLLGAEQRIIIVILYSL